MQGQQPAVNAATIVKRIVNLSISAWSVSVEVFLRRGFGSRYIGVQALFVMFLVPVYTMFWTGDDTRPMMCFLLAYLVLAVAARVKAMIRMARGEQTHSQFSGSSRLLTRDSRFCQIKMKKYVEPFVALGIGCLIGNHNPPLAIYLIIASFCLSKTIHEADQWMRTRAMDMNDAVFDQQDIAERFREMRSR